MSTQDLFLLARVADRALAVSADEVDSVVEIGTIVPAPGALAPVRGLAALRSRVVTVIDTRVALGLSSAGVEPTHAIITEVEGHVYAALVDELEDVAAFHMASAGAAPVGAAGWSAAGCGVLERDGEPVLVISLAALIPATSLAAPVA